MLLLGDFNAHSTVWGNTYKGQKGSCIKELITHYNICLFNNPSPTYAHQPQEQ